MKTLSLAFISALFCFLTISSNASDHREHKAHSHGIAKLNISIEKDVIEADLDIPGMDLVGFEGKAKTKEHKDRLKKVTELLTKDYNLFLIDEAAGCKVIKRKLDSDSNDHGAGHSEYEYEIEYKCKDIAKAKELDVNIFRDIESLNEVTVQLVTEKIQKEVKLNRTSSKVEL